MVRYGGKIIQLYWEYSFDLANKTHFITENLEINSERMFMIRSSLSH